MSSEALLVFHSGCLTVLGLTLNKFGLILGLILRTMSLEDWGDKEEGKGPEEVSEWLMAPLLYV